MIMLPSEERIRLLSLVDIFEPLSAEEIERPAGQLPDIHLKRGEIFYSPEDRSARMFALWKGRVRVYKTSDGREFTLAVVEAGTVFGEMALTAQRLQEAYAQAMEPSEVSVIRREDLERLILDKPAVGLQIAHLLSDDFVFGADRSETNPQCLSRRDAGPTGSGQEGPGGGEVDNTQSSPSAISLPRGAGTGREASGEFSANPVTGTGSLSVSTNTRPGRSGFGPQLSLFYDSGVGDGAFGLAGASPCLSSPGKRTKNCRGRKLPTSRGLRFVWGRSPRRANGGRRGRIRVK
jgi:hypothetical protein